MSSFPSSFDQLASASDEPYITSNTQNHQGRSVAFENIKMAYNTIERINSDFDSFTRFAVTLSSMEKDKYDRQDMIAEFKNKSETIKADIATLKNLKEKLKGRESQISRKGYYPISISSTSTKDKELRGRQLQDIKVLLNKIRYILTQFKIHMQNCTTSLNLSKSTTSGNSDYLAIQIISSILYALGSVMMGGGRKTRRVKKLKNNKNNKTNKKKGSTRRRIKK